VRCSGLIPSDSFRGKLSLINSTAKQLWTSLLRESSPILHVYRFPRNLPNGVRVSYNPEWFSSFCRINSDAPAEEPPFLAPLNPFPFAVSPGPFHAIHPAHSSWLTLKMPPFPGAGSLVPYALHHLRIAIADKWKNPPFLQTRPERTIFFSFSSLPLFF